MEQFQFSEKDRAQTEALIAILGRTLIALTEDINSEESRTGMHNASSPTYPLLALHLRARYDNLNSTITVLRARLPRQISPDQLAC